MRKSRQKEKISVAAVQLAITEETDEQRLVRVRRLLEAVGKVDLVLLPELWRVGYFNFSSCPKKAETLDGETVSFLKGAAKKHGAYLLGGSIVERDRTRLYNTAVFCDPAGELIGAYRKNHLLSVRSQERDLLTPGEEITMVETPIGTLGLAICYDLRFPELFRAMSERRAELFLIPACWPSVRSEAWDCLCRARAAENQAIVVACNATGKSLLGRRMVVDPWAVKVASLGDEEGILRAKIDIRALRDFREEFPAWRER